MGTAPFFFLLASLLIMVRDGEVRFLLVKLGDSEGLAKEISRTEGCTVFGHPGDGTERGTCHEKFLCHDDGSCKPICTVEGDVGDGTSRGSCPQGRLCFSDGTCKISVGTHSGRCVNSVCPCFWGSNMVHMRNGGRRSISDVKVGDSVLAVDEMGQLRFSQVIIQLHAEPEVVTKFQVIRTKTGRNLTLTPRHLIYKADSEIASSKPLFAMRIKKGDFVFVFDEKLGMIKDEVVSNDIETEKGLYTPVTSHGNIIVGDILASSYAALENHSLLHLMFAPLRWFNEAKNALSSMEQMEQDEFSKYEHDDKGIHWYAEALLAFGTSIASEKPVCQ